MTDDEARLNEDAIRWHVRLRDGRDDDWDAFADWLASDPRHAAAYDVVEALDRDLDLMVDDLAGAVRANDDAPAASHERSRRFGWGWPASFGAAVAAAAAFLLYPQTMPGHFEIATRPGELRVASLGPDAEVTLNGSTRLRVANGDPRSVELVAGQAFFRVRHDASRPFEVRIGDDVLRDMGTEFDVKRSAAGLEVAVAEGEVQFRSGAERVTVADGRMLTQSARDGRVRLTEVRPGSIGTWRERRLAYAAIPLAQVAEDLERALGLRILVAASIRDRPFSGNLALRGEGEAELRRLAAALDVVIDRTADGWMMRPAGRAPD